MADVIPPVGQYSAHLQLRDRDWALNARERQRQQRQQRDAVVEHLPSTVETMQLDTNAHNEAAARAEGKSMHRVAPAAPQAASDCREGAPPRDNHPGSVHGFYHGEGHEADAEPTVPHQRPKGTSE